MKKILASILVLCLMAALMAPMALAEEPAAEEAGYTLGMGISLNADSSKENNAQVDATVAAVVLDETGKIIAAKIDVAQNKMDVTDGEVDTEAAFLTKQEKGEDYGMRKASAIGMEWYEQAAAFEQFVIGKTAEEVEAIETKEDGKHLIAVDEELYAGCSMSIGEFKEAVVKACKDEQGMKFAGAGSIQLGLAVISTAEESTPATADKDGTVKMYSEFAAVVVDDEGVIQAVVTDATQPKLPITEDGEVGELDYKGTKRELKEDYGMVAAKMATLEWYEQAANFEAYAVGKTAEELRATETKTTDNGHVVFVDEELFASVSISIDGMINVIAKAAGNALPAAEE